MTATHIPTSCLSDARRVLAAQDPDVSLLADRWPAKVWREALKVAMASDGPIQPQYGENQP